MVYYNLDLTYTHLAITVVCLVNMVFILLFTEIIEQVPQVIINWT